MKRMKKVWALVLALVMVLALGVTSAAADVVEVTPGENNPLSPGNQPSVEFTIVKKVVKADNAATPPAETFEFVLEDTAREKKSPADYGITLLNELKIETNGVGTKVKTIRAQIDTSKANTEGGWTAIPSGNSVSSYEKIFHITEKNDGKDGWTYSTAGYAVTFKYDCDTQTMRCILSDRGGDATWNAAEFTNTYTKASSNSYYYYTPTTTETKGSPKTFDAGIGVYAVSALLSVTGGAWVVGKKHK